MGSRDLPPIRQHGRLSRADRDRLQREQNEEIDELRAEDRAIAALFVDRQRRTRRIADIEAQLFPPTLWHRGRRPGPDRLTDPLPPLPEQPTWLWGRRLHAVCLRLLHRCGTLPLRQLHALLHLHGFGVAGDHPVKVLADALGHETEHGKAERRGRGIYRTTPDYRPPPANASWLTGVALPDLSEADEGPTADGSHPDAPDLAAAQ